MEQNIRPVLPGLLPYRHCSLLPTWGTVDSSPALGFEMRLSKGEAFREHEEAEAKRRFREIEDARKEETKPRRALLFGSFAFRNTVNATEADLHASVNGPSLSATEKELLLNQLQGTPVVGVAEVTESDLVADTYHSDDDNAEEATAVAVAEGAFAVTVAVSHCVRHRYPNQPTLSDQYICHTVCRRDPR